MDGDQRGLRKDWVHLVGGLSWAPSWVVKVRVGWWPGPIARVAVC